MDFIISVFFHCQLPSMFVGVVHRITGGSERPRGGGQSFQDATESSSSLVYRAGTPGTRFFMFFPPESPPSGRVSKPLQFLSDPVYNVRVLMLGPSTKNIREPGL
jgi:hypothetical protein